jgi:SAM-dependent methyltransferase
VRRLRGHGVEIGALGRPMPVHRDMTVHYVDRCTVEELRSSYPEIGADPIVAPTIVDDATRLDTIANERYDFLIAAHVLEHLANPVLALANWCRVVQRGGLLYLVLPHPRFTFDRRRPPTLLAHLVLDYESPSPERDYEHYLEYAVLVHRARVWDALAEARRLRDVDFSIHFHVFRPSDTVALLQWFSRTIRPVEIVEGPLMNATSDEFHLLVAAG